MNPGDFPEVWDSSLLSDLKACQAKTKFAHIDWWKRKGENVHLHAGGAFAKGIEAARRAFYIEGQSTLASEAIGIGALLAAYGDFIAPEGSAKSAERMAGALEFYFANYPLDKDSAVPVILPGDKHGIEFNFVHPLPINHPVTNQPLLYSGRLDAVMQFAGSAWGFDEKTTTQLGSSWGKKWNLRSQFLGYVWGSEQAGLPITGIVVRGVSILKTKYETQQSINEFPHWMVDEWYKETLSYINEALHCYETGTWRHNYDSACTDYGGCSFTDVCRSANKLAALETSFEQRHWDPVTRLETKL